ncbi:MAG: squalene/phytoene synthase family protein [Thermoanaerobaculia bacterium]|nr:squalene/phytoene synthase family protein [Thermoanaerobaculia bacterium]
MSGGERAPTDPVGSRPSAETPAVEAPRGPVSEALAPEVDAARIEDLLVRTSRTFALAIPLLPEPTCHEVTVGYLLFRIADTFEDASVHWEREQRQRALGEFAELLRQPSPRAAADLVPGWTEPPPSEHDGYVELVADTPLVVAAFLALAPAARETIARHTVRTAERMASFVERADARGNLRLEDLDDLRAYCYAVAGIVGEMLTELFVLGSPELQGSRQFLSERAAEFGEGLQLVNILKDSASDATEGRFYLPADVRRSQIFALARHDLGRAAEYVLELQENGGPDGVVAFTALPVELARATLDRVEKRGPGAKLTRPEVFTIHDRVHGAIAKKRPALPR